MSNYALNVAWATPVKHLSDKLFLVCLADHANASGICWPSIRQLSAWTGLAANTIRAASARSEAAKLVRKEQRLKDGCLFERNIYYLSDEFVKPEHRSSNIEPVVQSVSGGSSVPDGGVVQLPPPHIDKPTSESLIEPNYRNSSEDAEFESEWAAFERCYGFKAWKMPKVAARAAREKAQGLPPAEEMVSRIDAYSAELQAEAQQSKNSTPLMVGPANWYLQRRWESIKPISRTEKLVDLSGLGEACDLLRAAGITDGQLISWFNGVVFRAGSPCSFVFPKSFMLDEVKLRFGAVIRSRFGSDTELCTAKPGS